ncbi:MAG: [FeFe] hydrogenase H-cluster radical SAM maturase HydG, partial [Vampirovibrionia bacterium]
HKYCQPNALFTFKEYLLDYASDATRNAGLQTIDRSLANIDSEKLRDNVKTSLDKIDAGERDIYF